MKNYFLDIETYTWNEQKQKYCEILNAREFFYGGIMSDNGTAWFYKEADEMYKHVQKILQEKNAHIWAYNHAYDFYGYTKNKLKEFIQKPEIKMIRNQPLMILNLENGAKLIDLKAYFQGDLASNGEAIGFPKLERKKEVNNQEELHDYLVRDIMILKKLVELIRETYKETGYNPRSLLTASKSAMGRFIAYLNKNENTGYLLRKGKIHKNENTLHFLRQASKGGRTEVFQTKETEEGIYWDANSWYWKIMQTMPFPDILKEEYYNKEFCKYIPKRNILNKEGVSHATIQISVDLPIGLLAIRYVKQQEKEYKLVFPKKRGTILKGWWTNAELRFAEENGYTILKIHEATIYRHNLQVNPLKKYIEELYEFRLQKQKENTKKSKLQAKLIKQLGNGLYGKFVQQQKEKIYTWIKRSELEEKQDEGWKVVGEEGDYCIMKEMGNYVPPYQSIIVGSLISAHARIEITKILLQQDINNLYYCDTDGIITTDKHPKGIKQGNGLGEFKIEDQGKTIILKPKNYMIGNTIKIAGIPRNLHTKTFFTDKKPILRKNMILYSQNAQKKWEEIGTMKEEWIQASVQEPIDLPLYIEEYER